MPGSKTAVRRLGDMAAAAGAGFGTSGVRGLVTSLTPELCMAYAAGFLAAHTMGLSLAEAGRWGSVCAAEVISHFGARPQTDMKALVGG